MMQLAIEKSTIAADFMNSVHETNNLANYRQASAGTAGISRKQAANIPAPQYMQSAIRQPVSRIYFLPECIP